MNKWNRWKQRGAVSKEQQEIAYEWTELLWDQSFHLAEKS